MRLKLTAGDGSGFYAGYAAHLSLDGVDISRYVSRVVVECDGDKPISATIECLLTELEIDLPAMVEAIDITPQNKPESFVFLGDLPAQIRG